MCEDVECSRKEKKVPKNRLKIPQRYRSRMVKGMDVIDLVEHWGLSFCEGNILKYLLRDKDQDLDDLDKIIVYAKREKKRRKKAAKLAKMEEELFVLALQSMSQEVNINYELKEQSNDK